MVGAAQGWARETRSLLRCWMFRESLGVGGGRKEADEEV